jgi:ribosomal protein S18 acetylase RimI-like enzyme
VLKYRNDYFCFKPNRRFKHNIGLCNYWDTEINGEAYIHGVSIEDKYSGRGFGTQMMLELLTLLRRRGFTTATLAVLPNNKSAIRCYEKAGFKFVDGRLSGKMAVDLKPRKKRCLRPTPSFV